MTDSKFSFFSFSFIIVPLLLAWSVGLNAQLGTPYFDDFESGTNGWTSYAIAGQNDWQLATPNDWILDEAYSGEYAWITDAAEDFSPNSVMALQSPPFDLSNANHNLVLSFYMTSVFGNSAYGIVEYTTNGGQQWNDIKNLQDLNRNWYNGNNGFEDSAQSYYERIYSLEKLIGQSAVSFRFVLYNEQNSTSQGWAIDNFAIRHELQNVFPDAPSEFNDYSTRFDSVEFDLDINYHSDFNRSFLNTTEVYFSNDEMLDGADALIWSGNKSITSNSSFEFTFYPPGDIKRGEHFLLYKLDSENGLSETQENDNVGVITFEVDSTIVFGSYREDFEDIPDLWEPTREGSWTPTEWKLGNSDQLQIEGSHSGSNAWYITDPSVSGASNMEHYLLSPYLDFEQTEDNYLCFWYQTFTDYPGDFPNLTIELSKSEMFHNYWSTNSQNFEELQINQPRTKSWDCTCQQLSFLDNHPNNRIRFNFDQYAHFSGYIDQMVIDDIYIGPALPDLSIEQNKKYFFSTASGEKELHYRLFNGGPAIATPTTTEFYWSTDETLDAGDLLLGSKMEESLADTTFTASSFTFNLPTSATGVYYIIYKLDTDNQLEEIWENNNSLAMEVSIQPLILVPYSNDFETNVDNWSHFSSVGADDWEWATPNGEVIHSAFSGDKGWVTNADGLVTKGSRMHLLSPLFDLSNLESPVLEFDLLMNSDGSNCACDNGNMNMSYSIDGGQTWEILDTTSSSYKHWYGRGTWNGNSGTDGFEYNKAISLLLEDVREPTFYNYNSYFGRGLKRAHHYILDLTFLKEYAEVKFRYNLGADYSANPNPEVEGALIDNFKIVEATIDLTIENEKQIILSKNAKTLRMFLEIYNGGNNTADAVAVNYYLSEDDLLDSSDLLLDTRSIDFIRPETIQHFNVALDLPTNIDNYNHLLCQLDIDNLIVESNEQNNIGIFPIISEGINAFPYLEEFETPNYLGWNYYSITPFGNKHMPSSYRVRNRLGPNESGVQRYFNEGQLNLDRFKGDHWVTPPRTTLETPIFDLSNHGLANISFDLYCSGRGGFTSDRNGGTIEYSLDGGNSWVNLTRPPYSDAENWFGQSSSDEVWSGTYGWSDDGESGSFSGDLLTSRSLDIDHLTGNRQVQFRFRYESNYYSWPGGIAGFKLDNFKIEVGTLDLKIYDQPTDLYPTVAEPIAFSYLLHVSSENYSQPTVTKYYLSKDEIFDENEDVLLGQDNIAQQLPWSNTQFEVSIDESFDVTQNDYYLFVKIDAEHDMVESNEANNIVVIHLHFPDHVNYKAINGNSLNLEEYVDEFLINYEIENNGILPGAQTFTGFYWSEDSTLDSDDILLGNIEESALLSGETRMGQFTVPMQIFSKNKIFILFKSDAEEQLVESIESDNIARIPVWFDFFGELPPIAGVIYHDENFNGELDPDEQKITSHPVTLSPADHTTFSDQSGAYYYYVPAGSYQINAQPLNLWKLNSTPDEYDVQIGTNVENNLNFGFIPEVDSLVFSYDVTTGPIRCDRLVPVWICYENEGTLRADGLLSIELDSKVDLALVAPAPDSISDNTLFWNMENIAPFEGDCNRIYMELMMPSATSLGEKITINSTLSVDAVNTDDSFALVDELCEPLLCSFDPNDKLVYPQREDPNYTLFEEELNYTIRFQNTGNDTAFTVIIRDTLSDLLDWSSLRVLDASHPNYITMDNATGELSFVFDPILLPDSTTNEVGSHGFVKYAIRSLDGLPENSLLENKAGIFFDFNDPIITNTTQNLLVTDFPVSTHSPAAYIDVKVFPNPTKGTFSITAVASDPLEQVEILTLSGLRVFQQRLSALNHQTNLTVENQLQPGMYIIQVQGKDKKVLKKLVVF